MIFKVQETQNAMYLNEWRAVARGVCESTKSDSLLPHLLRAAFERLQQQELSLTAEKVELESQLKGVVHEAKVAKSELEKSQKLIGELKFMGEQKQNLIHRMQKKLLLVSRERDSYRQQLDSYEKDLTMCANTTTGSLNQVQSQKERIDNLEKICEEYRDLINKYENDFQNLQPNLYSGELYLIVYYVDCCLIILICGSLIIEHCFEVVILCYKKLNIYFILYIVIFRRDNPY